jgi:hypothetical protein
MAAYAEPMVRIRLLPPPGFPFLLFSITYTLVWQTCYSGLPMGVPVIVFDIAVMARRFLSTAAV